MRRCLWIVLSLLTIIPVNVRAQTDDAWTEEARRIGLFFPHPNSGINACDSSTEAFVAMGMNGGGFCIEKDERSAAAWETARQTCASVGKRLPEIAEFIYACKNYSASLNNMTNNYEWAGNVPIPQHYLVPGTYNFMAMGVPTIGNGYCDYGSVAWVASQYSVSPPDQQPASLTFRCVR